MFGDIKKQFPKILQNGLNDKELKILMETHPLGWHDSLKTKAYLHIAYIIQRDKERDTATYPIILRD